MFGDLRGHCSFGDRKAARVAAHLQILFVVVKRAGLFLLAVLAQGVAPWPPVKAGLFASWQEARQTLLLTPLLGTNRPCRGGELPAVRRDYSRPRLTVPARMKGGAAGVLLPVPRSAVLLLP